MFDFLWMQEEAAKHGIELEVTLKPDGVLMLHAIKGQLGNVSHFYVGNLICQRWGAKEWENATLAGLIDSFHRAEKGESVEDACYRDARNGRLLYGSKTRMGG